VKVEEQYQVKISNRFAALKNMYDVDISRVWENIRESIKSSATESVGYELKQHEPWFDDEC
jgi:uncharacterized alkaline shock family protein YloU